MISHTYCFYTDVIIPQYCRFLAQFHDKMSPSNAATAMQENNLSLLPPTHASDWDHVRSTDSLLHCFYSGMTTAPYVGLMMWKQLPKSGSVPHSAKQQCSHTKTNYISTNIRSMKINQIETLRYYPRTTKVPIACDYEIQQGTDYLTSRKCLSCCTSNAPTPRPTTSQQA